MPDLRAPNLRELVDTYMPTTPEESEHRSAMLALIDQADAPLDRDHYHPGHFTASAFVLSPDMRSILLIFHGKLLRWLQPGGHFEPGDRDVEAAARREVGEETGLSELDLLMAPLDLDVHVIPGRAGQPEHRHYDVRLLFGSRRIAVRAGDDAYDCRWLPLHECEQGDESVVRAVRTIRRYLAGLPSENP